MVEVLDGRGYYHDEISAWRQLAHLKPSRRLIFGVEEGVGSEEAAAMEELSKYPRYWEVSVLVKNAMGPKGPVHVLVVPWNCPDLKPYDHTKTGDDELFVVTAWDRKFPEKKRLFPVVADNLEVAGIVGRRVASNVLKAGRAHILTQVTKVNQAEFREVVRNLIIKGVRVSRLAIKAADLEKFFTEFSQQPRN